MIHAVGTNSMTRMGGLRRTMPVTFISMSIGLAALAGVPPFAGFFSKDVIIDQAWKVADGSSGWRTCRAGPASWCWSAC